MVLAVRAAQLGSASTDDLFLVLTLILGLVFLGVKAYEWNEKFEEHHVPGLRSTWKASAQQGQAQLFFSLYFAMTGLHALHMVMGVGHAHLADLDRPAQGTFTPEYMTPVDIGGLYWHFVDIIWIFLFPLLYLIDRHLMS